MPGPPSNTGGVSMLREELARRREGPRAAGLRRGSCCQCMHWQLRPSLTAQQQSL